MRTPWVTKRKAHTGGGKGWHLWPRLVEGLLRTKPLTSSAGMSKWWKKIPGRLKFAGSSSGTTSLIIRTFFLRDLATTTRIHELPLFWDRPPWALFSLELAITVIPGIIFAANRNHRNGRDANDPPRSPLFNVSMYQVYIVRTQYISVIGILSVPRRQSWALRRVYEYCVLYNRVQNQLPLLCRRFIIRTQWRHYKNIYKMQCRADRTNTPS